MEPELSDEDPKEFYFKNILSYSIQEAPCFREIAYAYLKNSLPRQLFLDATITAYRNSELPRFTFVAKAADQSQEYLSSLLNLTIKTELLGLFKKFISCATDVAHDAPSLPTFFFIALNAYTEDNENLFLVSCIETEDELEDLVFIPSIGEDGQTRSIRFNALNEDEQNRISIFCCFIHLTTSIMYLKGFNDPTGLYLKMFLLFAFTAEKAGQLRNFIVLAMYAQKQGRIRCFLDSADEAITKDDKYTDDKHHALKEFMLTN